MKTHSFFLGTGQNSRSETWNPFVDLSVPVVECRFRYDNEVRTGSPSVEFEVTEEGDGLECFSQPLNRQLVLHYG